MKTEKQHNSNILIRAFIKAKLYAPIVDSNTKSSELVRHAKNQGILYKYNDTTHYCMFRSIMDDKPVVIIIFIFKLSGPSTGSCDASDTVMDMISVLEKQLVKIEKMQYSKETDGRDKIMGVLKVVKVVEDDLNIIEGE